MWLSGARAVAGGGETGLLPAVADEQYRLNLNLLLLSPDFAQQLDQHIEQNLIIYNPSPSLLNEPIPKTDRFLKIFKFKHSYNETETEVQSRVSRNLSD